MELFIHMYAIIGIVHRLTLDLPADGKALLHQDALDIIDRIIEASSKRSPTLPQDPMHYVQSKLPGIRSDLQQFKQDGFVPSSKAFSDVVGMCVLLANEDRIR